MLLPQRVVLVVVVVVVAPYELSAVSRDRYVLLLMVPPYDWRHAIVPRVPHVPHVLVVLASYELSAVPQGRYTLLLMVPPYDQMCHVLLPYD